MRRWNETCRIRSIPISDTWLVNQRQVRKRVRTQSKGSYTVYQVTRGLNAYPPIPVFSMYQCQRLPSKQAVVKYDIVTQGNPISVSNAYTHEISPCPSLDDELSDLGFASARCEESAKECARFQTQVRLNPGNIEVGNRFGIAADPCGSQNFPPGSSAVHRWTGYWAGTREPGQLPFRMSRKIEQAENSLRKASHHPQRRTIRAIRIPLESSININLTIKPLIHAAFLLLQKLDASIVW